MANVTLIIGETGTGKSTSLRSLDHHNTFIISVLGKSLPFKNAKKYIKANKVTDSNYWVEDDSQKIQRIIRHIDESMTHIKTIIIDDFQYVMANEFMRRALEKGYDRFTEIGQHAWSLIKTAQTCRDDLNIFFLSHSEIDNGKSKCKTIGKMLDDKITIEGMFTVVLHSVIQDGQYKFLTQNDGHHIAKSPLEMFDQNMIDNNLSYVTETINNYYNIND